MIETVLSFLIGAALFFLPGVLLSFIIFPKVDVIERITYSIIFSISIAGILGVIFNYLGLFSSEGMFLVFIIFCVLFIFILILFWLIGVKYKTDYNKDIWYVLFFSVIGAGWRIWFFESIKNYGDAYVYSSLFIGKKVPDLGFYTGIALDHSKYNGGNVIDSIYNYFFLNNLYLQSFLITFLFLSLIYMIFCEFRNRKMAYFSVALMALGPIEIFHSTLNILGGTLSYISLLLLFLFFKSENKRIFWPALLLSLFMIFTYYTATMVVILASGGFVLSLILFGLFGRSKFLKNLKIKIFSYNFFGFLFIFILAISYLFLFSQMAKFTIDRTESIDTINKNQIYNFSQNQTGSLVEGPIVIGNYNSFFTQYHSGLFFGISAIGWQSIFFLVCGATFFTYFIVRRDFSKENIDLLICLLPIFFVSFGFFHVGMVMRIFDYFAFFGLLIVRVPKKVFPIFFVLSFIFILVSSFYVANDKRLFFETSDKEVAGALWIKNNLDGLVFSDQSFVNWLVQKGYYQVTGASDKDPLVYNLFYRKNEAIFLNTIYKLRTQLGIDYIVLTEKMREKYILMLDYPQRAVMNSDLYEKNLIKIYDNGEVKVYETQTKNETTQDSNIS